MKIIGGKFSGRNFYMPKDIKPTQNLVRKALFDMLGQDLSGLTFLDLFAGSGGVGLEAYSRGASRVTFVEKDPKAAGVIEENLRILYDPNRLSGAAHAHVIQGDVFVMIKDFAVKKKEFDIIFFDPPYERELAKKTLNCLDRFGILHPNSLVIAEHRKREILPEREGRFLLFKQKSYGSKILSLYRCEG